MHDQGTAGGGGGETGTDPTHRGKGGAKRSLLVDAAGVPIGLAIDGANRHDKVLAEATIESIPVHRDLPEPGGPAQHLCLDKGYDYDDIRAMVAELGFTAHVRARGEEAREL